MTSPFLPHRIRRQRCEVRAPDRETAFALRAQLRRDVEDVLLPAVERAFDAAEVGDQRIRIPRLAVQLRVRSVAELSEALASQLPALIAEQLEAALSGTARGAVAGALRQSPVAHRRRSLLHYLATGQLDWPDAQGDGSEQTDGLREEAATLAELWRVEPALLRSALPVSFEQIRAFLFRLLQLLPAAQREAWCSAMRESVALVATAPRAQLLQALRSLAESAAQSTHGNLRTSADMLALAFMADIPPAAEILSVLHGLPTGNAIGIETLEALLRGELMATALLPVLPTRRREGLRKGAPTSRAAASTQAADKSTESGVQHPALGTPQLMPGSHAAYALPPAIFAAGQPPIVDEAAVLRVQLAGLVLAHPFLSSLFAARGLLDADGKTLLPHQLPRAAAMLHWLACGRDELFEFELGLIKPLLGLRPDDALPVSQGLLDADDHAECIALLTAMVSHWPALRSTSVEGLRVSFLQRQGLLRNGGDGLQAGWQLQPESESFDMLLGQLPWSISIVRLPWMTRPIFTDWLTR